MLEKRLVRRSSRYASAPFSCAPALASASPRSLRTLLVRSPALADYNVGVMGPPESHEAAPYYFRYIDRVPGRDILRVLETQRDETLSFLAGISEERSLHRYAPEKWSIRQVWNHVNDAERVFLFRAFWFARGFDTPLPSYDQDVAVASAEAGEIPWAGHV